jgi:signal transduction histidine kinase/ActR/RegA family two-component response regulator
MNGLGVINLIAGLLQLIVPSYSLRLVRRFGAQRVGWFVVAAFVSLAALNLMAPTRAQHGSATSGMMLDGIFAFACGLLLIGMGHLETMLTERQQAASEEKALARKIEAAVAERTAELSNANDKLAQEIAQRERQEKSLKESETQYRFLFSENPQPMLIFHPCTLGVLAANQAAIRQYGFSTLEFRKMTVKDLVPEDSATAFLEEISRPCCGPQARGLWQHQRRDLGLIEVEVTAMDVNFGDSRARLLVSVDTGPWREQERDQREEEKTKLIGRMAGGCARQFNKLIALIDSQTKLLLSQPHEPKALESLKLISTAAQRGTRITNELMAAGGEVSVRPEPIDLNGAILKASQMVNHLVGETIRAQTELGPGLPPVLADPRFVEHALYTLILNARDAMPAGGTLTIQTAVARIEQHQTRLHPGARAGDFVRLAIRDTGCGMTPEVQAHLFEPFLSTCDSDTATGLGLAGLWGAIKQQGGWIGFKTDVGEGTEFHVYFPCTRQAPAAKLDTAHFTKAMVRGCVLLVEPDDRIRGLARYGLNRQGYNVIEADCAATVMHLWEGQASKVELAVIDASQVGDSSSGLACKLRQTRPDLRIVCTTATSEAAGEATTGSIEAAASLSKPYTVDQLLQSVRAAWPKAVGS